MATLRILALVVVAAVAVEPGFSVERTFNVTVQQVAAVLSRAGGPVVAHQVEMLANVPSSIDTPMLDIVSAESHGRVATVRMRCRDRAQCLPFFVQVSFDHVEQAVTATEAWSPRPAATAGGSVKHLTKPTVRAGQTVTLMLEGERMRIELPALCLENGYLGTPVRVMSADRKHKYVGQLVSEQVVRGKL